MRFYSATIFADKSFTPFFKRIPGLENDVVLRLHSGSDMQANPEILVFFSSTQEATNFKNAIISSWETFLRNAEKEKS